MEKSCLVFEVAVSVCSWVSVLGGRGRGGEEVEVFIKRNEATSIFCRRARCISSITRWSLPTKFDIRFTTTTAGTQLVHGIKFRVYLMYSFEQTKIFDGHVQEQKNVHKLLHSYFAVYNKLVYSLEQWIYGDRFCHRNSTRDVKDKINK
jgi:hypothetical protein